MVMTLSALAIFVALLTGFSSLTRRQRLEASQDNASVRLSTELVSLRVTVTDQSGRAIEGLSKDDFKVYEDKVEQSVSFFNDEDAPASIGIVFDTSNSMSAGKIMLAKEALARFIQTSHEQDEYFLIDFDSPPHLLLDLFRAGVLIYANTSAGSHSPFSSKCETAADMSYLTLEYEIWHIPAFSLSKNFPAPSSYLLSTKLYIPGEWPLWLFYIPLTPSLWARC
jgi:hypothetical protein